MIDSQFGPNQQVIVPAPGQATGQCRVESTRSGPISVLVIEEFQANRGLIYSRNAPYDTDGGFYYVRFDVKL